MSRGSAGTAFGRGAPLMTAADGTGACAAEFPPRRNKEDSMADFRNPNDPLDPLDTRSAGYRDLDDARDGTRWGWIAGAVAVLLLLGIFIFGFGRSDRTASTDANPQVTTNQTTPAPSPPAATAPRPAAPQENTGSR